MSQTKTKWLTQGFALRLFVSIGIISLLIWWISPSTLRASISRVEPSLWAAIIFVFLCGHVVAALKWRLILLATGIKIRPLVAIRAHAAGLFANICLPSIVGGDLVRAALVVRSDGALETVAVGSLADRLSDTVALILISAIAGLYMPGSASTTGIVVSAISIGLLLAVFGGITTLLYLSDRFLPDKLLTIRAKIRAAVIKLIQSPHLAIAGLILSMLIQSGFIALNVVLAKAMGLSLSSVVWFFGWPLAKLVALVPISLGGIGVRETALVSILAPFHNNNALVVSQSLSWQAVLIISGLIAGGAGYLLRVWSLEVPEKKQT